jgi:serine/threonine protein kinase
MKSNQITWCSYILQSGQPGLSLKQALILLRDVALGTHHLHREGFIWRDMAARNVMLCKEGGDNEFLRAKCVFIKSLFGRTRLLM